MIPKTPISQFPLLNTQPSELAPPIKWPGGKTKEYEYFRQLIPPFERYIEPFFGGGAVFFKLLPPKKALINDFSEDLITFYKFLKNDPEDQFATSLQEYVHNWEKVPDYIHILEQELIALYDSYRNNTIHVEELESSIETLVSKSESRLNGLFSNEFCISQANLLKQISRNLVAKLKRMAILESRHGDMSRLDVSSNIETAFRSGFYMHFRDLMNRRFDTTSSITSAKASANYYFIREFCYGSMFRYNNAGDFNIPYGGIAYNRKDFAGKVNRLLSGDYRTALKNTTIKKGDFESVLKESKLNPQDFVFLDPPYDSEFSEYDQQSFDRNDQARLAHFIKTTPAKCLLVIKSTPFILSLYADTPTILIESFEKKYQYNVKGRNDQDVTHLIIRNY